MIRLMDRADARAVAAIHARVLPESIYSTLGPSFLDYYYSRLTENDDFICHVDVFEGRVTGFLASSPAAGSVFFRQMTADAVPLALVLTRLVVGRPSTVFVMGRAAKFLLLDRRRFPIAAQGEVLSLAVLPEYRTSEIGADGRVRPTPYYARHGINIGRDLFRRSIEALAARGVSDLKIMTGSGNVASNRFYRKMGCRLVARDYPILGEASNLYYARIADLLAPAAQPQMVIPR